VKEGERECVCVLHTCDKALGAIDGVKHPHILGGPELDSVLLTKHTMVWHHLHMREAR
jgi:hypothetical protein